MACLRLRGKQLPPPSPLLGLELVPGMGGCPRNGDRDGTANLQLWWGKSPQSRNRAGQWLCFGAATRIPWLWDRKFQEKTLHTQKFGKPPLQSPSATQALFLHEGCSQQREG